jgi:hypothetical protein
VHQAAKCMYLKRIKELSTPGVRIPECIILEVELVFSNSKKFQTPSFKKIQKKYQSVVNESVYLYMNFHHEIPRILPSVKITKLQIWEHEQYPFQNLSDFVQFVFFAEPKLQGILHSNFASS